MPEFKDARGGIVDPAQAASLAVLVDLEARWENLRKARTGDAQVRFTLQDLQSKQKAYEAFRGKLVAYNKRYKPAHIPEMLLNTPIRLGTWCKSMSDLFRLVENDPHAQCPVQLVEKAYRWADLLGAHLKKPVLVRSMLPANIRSAIRELEELGQWCDKLTGGADANQAIPVERVLAAG